VEEIARVLNSRIQRRKPTRLANLFTAVDQGNIHNIYRYGVTSEVVN